MRIVRDLSNCPKEAKGAVIALGNFDGVHLGHQSIISHCVTLAKAEGKPAAVMTFEPHPREFFARQQGQHNPLRICSFHQKAAWIAGLGVKWLFVTRFNHRLAATPAKLFVEDILHGQLEAYHVVTGYNFAFGKGRGGDTAFLMQEAKACGFSFTAHPAVEYSGGGSISSSHIRELLAKGEMKTVGKSLGRPYMITGKVRRGDQRGRVLGFPTANIALGKLFRPRYGVYAARARVAGDITWHDGVANLGIRPTFSNHEPLLETHLFSYHRDIYGKRLDVELVDFIRDEKKFDTPDALKAHIAKDCEQAKRVLA